MLNAFGGVGSILRWLWNTKIIKRDRTIEIQGKKYDYTLEPEERLEEYLYGEESKPFVDLFIGLVAIFMLLFLVVIIIMAIHNANV